MSEHPSGLVTFLFTDIEGSTRLWESHPTEMGLSLTRHDELVRSVVEAADGYVFKTVGDAFCVAFASADGAVDAAVSVQRAIAAERWPEAAALRVRMAVHAGECSARDGDYFGPTVNRVARLEAIAHGGQVVVSGRATALLTGHLPDGVRLRDMGEHRLKDLTAPERVFQLDIEGLPDEFPPLRSLTNPALLNNLPRYASSFVGRTTEAGDVQSLVGDGRLVTLVGAGGCGKTRLAVQVAAELLDGSSDGVWLVELATLSDGALVAATVASTLGIRPEPASPVIEALLGALRSRRMLIVLDNCEHVIDGAAALVDTLLSECPEVAVIATSREALRIAGEQVYRVESLETPPDGSSIDVIVATDAVQLFAERARSHQPDFRLDDGNAALVGAICRQLDGIPLAIELAAARLPSLSLVDIEQRLRERFRLLTTGTRTALPRQQTLRALIDWSYDLLDDGQRLALCRLSAFAGGCTMDAAEAVVADGDRIEHLDVLDLVTALTDKSLLGSADTTYGTRYTMLESVREYAAEHLGEGGEQEPIEVARRHRDYYLARAELAKPQLSGPDQAQWCETLTADYDNLRAALTFTLDQPDHDDEGLRFLVALGPFWERVEGAEGIRYASTVLGRTAPRRDDRWAAALQSLASLHLTLGRNPAARPLLDEALTIAERGDDHALVSRVLNDQGFLAFKAGQLDVARTCYERSLSHAREHHDDLGELSALQGLADVLTDEGDELGWTYYEQALALARTANDLGAVAVIRHNQSVDEFSRGNFDAAGQLAGEALALSRELHLGSLAGFATLILGGTASFRITPSTGQAERVELLQRAKASCLEALDIARRAYDEGLQAAAFGFAASTASFGGDALRAATLRGFGDAMTERLQVGGEAWIQDWHATDVARLRETLGDDAFDTAYQRGQTLSLAEATILVHDIAC